jgi:hypothetical protein
MYPGCGGGEVIWDCFSVSANGSAAQLWTDLASIFPTDYIIVFVFAPLVMEDLTLFYNDGLKRLSCLGRKKALSDRLHAK